MIRWGVVRQGDRARSGTSLWWLRWMAEFYTDPRNVQPHPRSELLCIRDTGGQAERTIAIEGVGDALAKVVVVDSVSGADGSFAWASPKAAAPAAVCLGRIGNGEARRNIFVIPRPVRLESVGLSRERKAHQRLIGLTGEHVLPAPLEPTI